MSVATMDMRVALMVSKHERTVERRAGLTAVLGGALARLSVNLATIVGSMIVRKQVAWMLDQAVWFRGAAANIDASERLEVLDPDWKLISRLRSLEGRLAELQGLFANMSASKPSSVTRHMLVALSDLHESVRDLRGAIQAYEADRCALGADGRFAETSDALNEAIARLVA